MLRHAHAHVALLGLVSLATIALAACGPSATRPPAAATSPASNEIEETASTAEPVSMVIVVEGHLVWIGNDTFTDDEGTYPGHHRALVAALDGLRGVGPAGSRISTITYGRGAVVHAEWKDADEFEGAMIGSQQDIAGDEEMGQYQRDLVAAVEQARAILGKAEGHRVLVVFGDAMDTNLDTGGAMLGELGEHLRGDGVDVHAVYLESELESDPSGFAALTSNVTMLSSEDGLAGAVSSIAAAVGD